MFFIHLLLGGFLQSDTLASPWRVCLVFSPFCDSGPTSLSTLTQGPCLASPPGHGAAAHPDPGATDRELLVQTGAHPQPGPQWEVPLALPWCLDAACHAHQPHQPISPVFSDALPSAPGPLELCCLPSTSGPPDPLRPALPGHPAVVKAPAYVCPALSSLHSHFASGPGSPLEPPPSTLTSY